MLTVLFATHNGSKTLNEALTAYCHLKSPPGQWKLVIVDNGSTDNTRSIIRSFEDVLPLTYLYEPKPGKNAALNTGLRQIEGDLVVLTDDDTLPCSDWLIQYREASNSHTGFDIFGGPIFPKWEKTPESWLLSWVPLGPVFAVLDYIEADGPVPHYLVYGPNMAIRSTIFQTGVRFDESIGPRGKNYAQGSETQLLLKLRDKGHRAWHCTGATVQHMIRSSQMDRSWVLNRAIRYGRGQYRLGVDICKPGPQVRGVSCRLMLRILMRLVISLKVKLSRDEEQIFKARWNLNYDLGRLTEAYYISSNTLR